MARDGVEFVDDIMGREAFSRWSVFIGNLVLDRKSIISGVG